MADTKKTPATLLGELAAMDLCTSLRTPE